VHALSAYLVLTISLPEPVVFLIEHISTDFRMDTQQSATNNQEDAGAPCVEKTGVAATNEAVNRSSKEMTGVTTSSLSGGVVQPNEGGGGSVGRTTIGGFLVGIYFLILLFN
jgi:hypothetical protein